MKALVIGASGLVGAALMEALGRAGIDTCGTASSQVRGSLSKLDIKDRQATGALFEAVRPDTVFLAVNTAGGVDYCETHPEEARALNVTGTQHVAECAREFRVKLVYYSTDYVFDGARGPYTEEDQPNPVNVYGRSKRSAETIVREQAADHLVIRTTAVYGWHPGSKNFAMQIWEQLGSGVSLRVPDDQLCNPTLAEHLAETSIRLVQAGARGTFNVVGKDRISRFELGFRLARAMGFDASRIEAVRTAETGQGAARPLAAGLRTERVTEFLGTEPLNIRESLARFKRAWRSGTQSRRVARSESPEAARLRNKITEDVKAYYRLAHQGSAFVPFESRVPFAGRIFGEEEMVHLVDSALDFWLTLGPYGELFERKMKHFFDARDFVFVNSGSTANLTAVMSLMSSQLERPLKPGDEVITPAVTFPTTLAPIVHNGLIPVFVDCEVGTYNINPGLIEGALSKKTRAIMVPHTLGNPCDMETLCDVAQRHHLFLIEDCCDALGSTFNGRLVGTFGDLATLSFYPAHHITVGEGGGVVVNGAKLSRIVRSVRDWGRDCWCATGESNTCSRRFGWQMGDLPKGYDHKYIYTNLGYNFKPTDMQAAIGVAQSERIGDFIKARKRNFRRLYEGLKPYEELFILPRWEPAADPSWFGFPITVRESGSRRDIVQWLEAGGIETRAVFGGNVLRQPAYRGIQHRIHGTLEASDKIMEDTFFIGVYPGLSEEMIHHILDRFHVFIKDRKAAVSVR